MVHWAILIHQVVLFHNRILYTVHQGIVIVIL